MINAFKNVTRIQNPRTKENIHDAFIIKDFMQSTLKFDPAESFQFLHSLDSYPDSEPIPFDPSGQTLKLTKGSHPALSYRGNALNRNKIWLQTNYEQGMLKYGYTGFQWCVSNAAADINTAPVIKKVLDKLNEILPESAPKMNHVIATLYNGKDDSIGMHSDKDKDFVDDSYFIVIKLGHERDFLIQMDGTKEEVFRQKLNAGDAVLIRAKGQQAANNYLLHGVPPMLKEVGPSGSLVFRAIKTNIPWETVQENIQKSQKQKEKRQNKKRKREAAKALLDMSTRCLRKKFEAAETLQKMKKRNVVWVTLNE